MKKAVISILFLTVVTGSLKAQLENSKWKGVLKLDNPLDVAFNFGKDTLTVVNLYDNSIVETMTYSPQSSGFTLKKVSGQSGCDPAILGKYKYQLKDKTMLLTVVDDACDDRAPYLNNLQLTKS